MGLENYFAVVLFVSFCLLASVSCQYDIYDSNLTYVGYNYDNGTAVNDGLFDNINLVDLAIVGAIVGVIGIICIVGCIYGYMKYKVWKFNRDF